MEAFSSTIQQILTHQPPLEAEAGGLPVQGLQTSAPSTRLRVDSQTESTWTFPMLTLHWVQNRMRLQIPTCSLQLSSNFTCISPTPGKSIRQSHTLKCRSNLKQQPCWKEVGFFTKVEQKACPGVGLGVSCDAAHESQSSDPSPRLAGAG